jgi:hypothetical protein
MPRKSSETIDPQLDEEELLRVEGFKCRKKSKGKTSENKKPILLYLKIERSSCCQRNYA